MHCWNAVLVSVRVFTSFCGVQQTLKTCPTKTRTTESSHAHSCPESCSTLRSLVNPGLRVRNNFQLKMKIEKLNVYQVDLPVKEGSYNFADGKAVSVFDSTVVEVVTDSGIRGYGEVCIFIHDFWTTQIFCPLRVKTSGC